ncbi:sporulation-control protein spo0M [Micromonospora pisi]|uniref:Sporulation-control protein spo0M n=1 Tax=Micromonospora pisi TaxID=589240 RepID=A0A495JS39_9ACTN|nr:sporulation protein [Micromonospora pisi]RKR90879.1 sporulation-control protein spo0M [Micromonospora pisi]
MSADAGFAVRTVLTNPSTRPGLLLPGRVTIVGGSEAVPVDHVVVGLVTRAEPADGGDGYVDVEFGRVPVAGAVVLAPGECRAVTFAAPMPWELPVTVVDGRPRLNLPMDLRTEVALGPCLDRGGLSRIFVHPLPAQERILEMFGELGFTLRQVGLQQGTLPGVEQTLPFHQKIGYWAAPLYGGPFSEIELTFLASAEQLQVVFVLDRRLALAGASHVSLTRFRVRHADVDQLNWARVVDSWVRHAVARHAAVRSGAQDGPPLPESVNTSRPPDLPPEGEGISGTAGGEGGI